MKNPVLFIFLSLILITGNAQPPVFNKLITLIDSSYDERITQAIDVGDGYLLAGNTEIHSVGHYWVYVYLVTVKIDRQGNIVKRRVYGDTSRPPSPTNPPPFRTSSPTPPSDLETSSPTRWTP